MGDAEEPRTAAGPGDSGRASSAMLAPLSKQVVYQPLPPPHNNNSSKRKKADKKPKLDFQLAQGESGLMDFLHHTSVQYHQRSVMRRSSDNNNNNNNNNGDSNIWSDAYQNTGGRPTMQSEYAEKLQGRALTLVGGGFTKNQVASSSIDLKNKRKRQESQRWNRFRKRKRTKEGIETENTFLPSAEQVEKNLEFLYRMNQLWNRYAWDMLMTATSAAAPQQNTGNDHHDTGVSVDRSVAAHMEWVGAHVVVHGCTDYPAYVGRKCFVVAVTTNTWCLAQEYHRKTSETKVQADQESANEPTKQESICIRHFYVPKRNTSLQVFLPVERPTTTTTKETLPPRQSSIDNQRIISILIKLDST